MGPKQQGNNDFEVCFCFNLIAFRVAVVAPVGVARVVLLRKYVAGEQTDD